MANYMAIEIECHACIAGEQFSASGQSLSNCPKCSGTGYLSWGRLDVSDVVDTLSDIEDKINDIKEVVDEL